MKQCFHCLVPLVKPNPLPVFIEHGSSDPIGYLCYPCEDQLEKWAEETIQNDLG